MSTLPARCSNHNRPYKSNMKLIVLALAAAALASCASKPNPAPSTPTGGYVQAAK